MNLSPAHQLAVSDAMSAVRQRHDAAQQAPDLETTRQALFSLSVAVTKALAILNTAEAETRAAALDARTRKAFGKLESAA